MGKTENKVQLITYSNSLGQNMKELNFTLNAYLKDIVFGVHILPFFPSSSDRGFSPINYFEVDRNQGSWEDIRKISRQHEIMVDFIVNHVSSKSKYFKDYLKRGEESRYADYFITKEKFSRWFKKNGLLYHWLGKIANYLRRMDFFFHSNGVNRLVLKKIYRPRPGSPFVRFKFANGKTRDLWCSFSSDQIDVDINNPEIKKLYQKTIKFFSEQGIKIIRLDAVGYAAKIKGTSNFMIPQVYTFVSWLADIAHTYGMTVLPEVHHHYSYQLKLARTRGVDFVYDFALPMVTLNAIFTGNNANLLNWLKIRPQNTITTLDTHDGLPVPDVEGLISLEEKDELVKKIIANGGNEAFRASGTNSNNVDIYQINCTYYSALGNNDDAYILSRAIQMFVPGIPQIYYVGLLAGANDAELLAKTGIGRDINRHNYTLEEIKTEVERPVVKRLFKLIQFRNSYPAFNGEFEIKPSETHQLTLTWRKNDLNCELTVNFKTNASLLTFINIESKQKNTITL